MLGGFLVIIWLVAFSLMSYGLCTFLKLDSALFRTIFVWTFLMFFVAIFEMMLPFNLDYLETKGKQYYADNSCYWTDNTAQLTDMFSSKMYMDLYADYSLCDKRYCENVKTNEGCRFVLTGEIIHGLFCIIMVAIIMYLFFTKANPMYIYLASFLFSGIQFAMIVWYLVSVAVEKYYVKNDQFWWPPLLWNVPWVIVPLYICYYVKEQTGFPLYIK